MALKTKLSETLTVFGAQRVRQVPMEQCCRNKYISNDSRRPLGVSCGSEELNFACTVSHRLSHLLNEGDDTLTLAAPSWLPAFVTANLYPLFVNY